MTFFRNMKKVIHSFKYAIQGITYVFRTQRNMKIHLVIAFLAIFLSLGLNIPKDEFLLVLFAIVFVMCMELINTAIESIVDLITTDFHPLAKIAKDVASGAVLFAAILAFIIGVYVFMNPLLTLFSSK